MIYLLCKDQKLSGLIPGKHTYLVATCSEREQAVARMQICKAGYVIVRTSDMPIEDQRPLPWKRVPRVK